MHVISSDSEDERDKRIKSPKKSKIQEEKLQPVNIDDVFGNKPIKQSKVDSITTNKQTEVKASSSDKKERKKSKSKRNPETEIHQDEDFEKTLLDVDDDLILKNVDFLDKTVDEERHKDKKKHTSSEGIMFN